MVKKKTALKVLVLVYKYFEANAKLIQQYASYLVCPYQSASTGVRSKSDISGCYDDIMEANTVDLLKLLIASFIIFCSLYLEFTRSPYDSCFSFKSLNKHLCPNRLLFCFCLSRSLNFCSYVSFLSPVNLM